MSTATRISEPPAVPPMPDGPPGVAGEAIWSAASSTGDGARRPGSGSSTSRQTHRWSRLIHVYTSMIALLVVLFFALTGITVNHPEWTFGSETTTETVSGTFPFPAQVGGVDGTTPSVDFLSISEFVRDTYDVAGSVDSFAATNDQGSIAYRNPGYTADLIFDVETGAFDLTIEQQGWVAVMNDMHKGRDAGSTWKWVIDIAAGFLVVISVTGLVMQFFLKKRRRSAFVTAGVGVVVTVGLIAVALA